MQKKTPSSRPLRQSNIELLRIVTACFVIVLHYNNPMIGGALASVPEGSGKQLLLYAAEAVAICAVDLFVMIPGYFLRHTGERDLLKPLELLSQLVTFELLFFCVRELPKGGVFTLDRLLKYFVPSYWFVFVYIALYLISPYVNLAWDRLSSRGRKRLLALVLGLFSFWPMLLEAGTVLTGTDLNGWSTVGLYGAQSGYTIVQFMMLYLIGMHLRDLSETRFTEEAPLWKPLLLLTANAALLIVWTFFEKRVLAGSGSWGLAWKYLNPLVISEAALFFETFRRLRMKNSRIINSLAAASFPAYLIHINLLPYLHIDQAVQGSGLRMAAHLLLSVLAVYLASWLLHRLYLLAAGPLFRRLGLRSQRWRCMRAE